MDDTEQQDHETTDDAAEGRPAQTVKVPNVSPGAKSGLDHVVIGADALEPTADDADPGPSLASAVPQGDVEAALTWVGQALTLGQAKDRADAVWLTYASEDGYDNEAKQTDDDKALATRLRSLVYGTQANEDATKTDEPLTVPEGLEGEALDAWVSGDAEEGDEQDNPDRWAAYLARREAAGLGPLGEVEGQVVESDTAGTGDAINDDTGVVTKAGDPLPPIDQPGQDGTDLDAADPGPSDPHASDADES